MKWISARTTFAAACLATLALAGCTASEPRQADVPLSTMGPKPLAGVGTDGEAERLVVGAAACWLGGLWSDAVGETEHPLAVKAAGEQDSRIAGIRRRCESLLVHVYGIVDPMQYTQLRAVEPRVVDDIAARVRAFAENDRADHAHADDLVKMLHAVAEAQRENVIARAAADDVKRDEDGTSVPRERAVDKTYAARALRRTTALEALLTLDAGDLTHDARVIGVLCALDRLEIARKLPKHLKVYAVGGPFVPIFGVLPPQVPDDPTAPIATGTWPGYLVDVAGATGHPVPAEAVAPIDRESLAWGGVLQAFADRLRAEGHGVSPRTPLPLVIARVADRLSQESHTVHSLFVAEQRQRAQK